MKRTFRSGEGETEKEVPELPMEIWNLIVLEIPSPLMCVDYLNTQKLKYWTKFSLLNQSFRAYFLDKISTKNGLKEIYPTFPKEMPNFESFSRLMKFERSKYGIRENITEWLRIAVCSERYFQQSKASQWIVPIESFTKFLAPIMKHYSINKKTYGGQINELVKKIDRRWDDLTPFTKTKTLYLVEKLFYKYHKKPLPTVKKPCENTKYGCLMAYKEDWREEGELNGKRGEIYSDSGQKLYLGAFKPLMALSVLCGYKIYHFAFQHYNGDKLRHHNILRETNDRLSSLTLAMEGVESLL